MDTPEEELTGWRQELKTKVSFSHHCVTQQLIEAAEEDIMVSIYYHGGRECGRFRKFSPEFVFRTPNSLATYVTGFCHLRKAHRVFRTDRISLA
jgi:predicted DNA-binding transcriptional regulator YafY